MDTVPGSTGASIPISHPRLPRWAPHITGVVAIALAGLICLLLQWGMVAWAIIAVLLFLVMLPGWSLLVENKRAATDRFVTGLVWSTFLVALVPLLSLVWTVLSMGASRIDGTFLTYSAFRTSLDQPTGIYHAIIGTVMITVTCAIISIPVGVMCAVYLVEYGGKSKLARAITFLVDVMTGIPSIVAGLFAFALFTLAFGPAYRSGLGGAVALSLLMIPVVVRSTEEMLRLVPMDLREASYALGVPKWRTITKVVLPTALAGIVTGVTIAIARVIGETAPLLLISGTFPRTNFNIFSERMTTLPVYIYAQFTNPGVRPADGSLPEGIQNAWGAALVLIVIVLLLNIIARIIGKVFAPPSGR